MRDSAGDEILFFYLLYCASRGDSRWLLEQLCFKCVTISVTLPVSSLVIFATMQITRQILELFNCFSITCVLSQFY
ncbi:hypothetical protein Scep_016723 [Stephania cephalantha]|uniref:Uncharacterized protein n=1 Tax=Stephania cephalantha TaxID=152367 RepID=A0AAP0NUY2_9MAGN